MSGMISTTWRLNSRRDCFRFALIIVRFSYYLTGVSSEKGLFFDFAAGFDPFDGDRNERHHDDDRDDPMKVLVDDRHGLAEEETDRSHAEYPQHAADDVEREKLPVG